MNKRSGYIIGLVIIVALVLGGWWWTQQRTAGSGHELRATGTIEVERMDIAAETGGRIVELAVNKGDEVRAGDVLVRLDTTMLDADLARTEAAIKALEKARDAAKAAWLAAQGARANPLDIDVKIAELQAQLDAAELQLQAARLTNDPAQLKVAETTRDGLQRVLDLLTTMRETPYALDAQVGQAEMIYQGTEALLQAAYSIRDLLRIQREKMTLTAPRDGFILDRLFAPGEIAPPLAPILVLADLREVTLTVYLPETVYGRVNLGDEVTVYVDSWPDRAFAGKVTYISPRAEFTPTNVQTPDERARLVYAVEIALPNEDLALKPGMIAEAVFSASR